MTPNGRHTTFTPDQLSQALADLATPSRPDYRDDLIQRTARSRQRPAWTFIERWLPVTLVTARHSTSPPLRAAWTLLIVGVLTAALITSLAIAGSQLLRDADPHHAMLPVLIEGDPLELADLSFPVGIDIGPDGNLYVVNTGTSEIVVLDPAGREVRRWGGPGTGEGQFLFERNPADPLNNAGGVAVAPDGSVYVADMVNDRIQQFSAEGRFVRAWGGHGPADGQFLEPFDVDIGPDGSVYVVDDERDDIQRFSAEGDWLETIGRHGTGDGEMDFTGGISVDAMGMILNADFGNQRIQAWDDTGAFLWSRAGFQEPVDVAMDMDGRVYVADAGQGVKLLGDGAEPDSIIRPAGWGVGYLAVSDDGSVYVSNPAAGRIDRLAISYEQADATSETPAVVEASPKATVDASSEPGATTPEQDAKGGPRNVRIGTTFPLPFTVALPSSTTDPSGGQSGWWLQEETAGIASFKYVRGTEATPAWVEVYIPAGVYRDPCHPDDGLLTTSDRPGVDELVEALTQQVGVRAGPVTDIGFGDVQGKTFDLDNTIDVTECQDAPWLHHWTFRSEGPASDVVAEGLGLPDSHERLAIVDVDGIPVLIVAWEFDARRDEVAEAYQLFESIRFE